MMKHTMKRTLGLALVAALLCSLFVVTPVLAVDEDPVPLPAQDENGWSIIPESEDTVKIYVSSSEGDDSNNGLTPETPMKNIKAAVQKLRDGYPDHLLLKRGDVWVDPHFGHDGHGGTAFPRFLSGRSAEEPIVISYYGDEGARPLLKISDVFIYTSGHTKDYVWLVGLEIRGYRFDPNDDDYDPTYRSPLVGVQSWMGWTSPEMKLNGGGDNWLIEDCKFDYMGIAVASIPNEIDDFRDKQKIFHNFSFRRNIVSNGWVPNSSLQQATKSGIYTSGVDGLLIEENVFDHNGWNLDTDGFNAGPNMYNHNMYIQSNNVGSKVVIRGNVVTRAAANGLQARSGGLVEDNLFSGNSIGMLIADDLTSEAGLVIESTFGIARNNVITESVQQLPEMSSAQSDVVWGLTVNANNNMPMEVYNNIVAHSKGEGNNLGIHNRGSKVTYTDNIQYDWVNRGYKSSESFDDMIDPGWLDPSRSVAKYNAEVLGGAESLDAFCEAAASRGLREWPEELTSYAVNAWIREGFTVTGENPDPDPDPEEGALSVTTDRNLISKGDYFNISVGFGAAVSSNVAKLTYTYDPNLFEYRGFTPADGVKTIDVVNNAADGVLTVTLMTADYNTTSFGKALFSARDDVNITNGEHSISVRAIFVVKGDDGKIIERASGSTGFSTTGVPGDITGDGVVDLIDLSDVIDGFGVTSEDADWSKYKFYDYNNNGIIDIADIAWVASLITD